MSETAETYPSTLPVPKIDRKHAKVDRSEITEMETSRLRARRMFEDPFEIIDVNWNFTEDEFNSFASFFTDTLENGSRPFYMLWDDSEVVLVAFRDPTYRFSRTDNLFSVSAALEVTELQEDVSAPADSEESVPPGSGSGSAGSAAPSESSGILGSDVGSSLAPGGDSSAAVEESSGESFPPPPNLNPIFPTPPAWPGASEWGPLLLQDPEKPAGQQNAYVAIPYTTDPSGYCNVKAGCLDAWVWYLWMDFLAQEIPYLDARIIWKAVNLTLTGYNARDVFPELAGGYPKVASLIYSPIVEYTTP